MSKKRKRKRRKFPFRRKRHPKPVSTITHTGARGGVHIRERKERYRTIKQATAAAKRHRSRYANVKRSGNSVIINLKSAIGSKIRKRKR